MARVGCVTGVQSSEVTPRIGLLWFGVCVPGLGVRRCLLTAGVDRACQGYKMLLNKSPWRGRSDANVLCVTELQGRVNKTLMMP